MKEETIEILKSAQINQEFIDTYVERTDDSIESNQNFWKDVIDNSVSPVKRLAVIDKVTAIPDMTEGLLLDYLEKDLVNSLPK